MRCLALLVTLALSSFADARPLTPSFAWSPPARVLDGGRRHLIARPDVQRALRSSPAWVDFLARHPGDWTARWDEATGTPIRFWGAGFPVDARRLAEDSGALQVAATILAEEELLLGGVWASTLVPETVDRKQGITTVTFTQKHRGLAVEHSRVSLRFKFGRFVMGQMEVVPVGSVPSKPTWSSTEATLAGLAALGVTLPEVTLGDPDLVILPIRGQDRTQAHLAWRIPLRRHDEVSAPVLWVSATDGRLLGQEERIRFATGTVLGEVDQRTPGWGLVQEPLPGLELEGESGDDTTDSSGAFILPGDPPQTIDFDLTTDQFDLDSADGQDLNWSLNLANEGGTLLVAPDPGDPTGTQNRLRSAIDALRFANLARDRALLIDPGFDWAPDQVDVHVNLDEDGCNAWFDENSDLNFLRAANGCENTGRIADVVEHEYGHGFHLYSIISGAGDWGDGSIGEGLSDYLSATINNSSDMALGFFLDPNQPLRDLDANARWPDDINGDIHITGLIIAGALWDLREALRADLGDSAGTALADQLFFAVAARAADIPDSYAEVLLADDDNGNLADGTPHRCTIDEQFAIHGLADLGPGFGFGLQHEAPLGVDAHTPITLSAIGQVMNPECNDGAVGGVRVRWTADQGAPVSSWATVDLDDQGGGTWQTELPSQETGAWVRYQLELIDDGGEVVSTLPSGSVTDPWFGVWVGGGEVIAQWDFEDDDGGFTHELVWADDPREGSDDWAWDDARGAGGDPAVAASGDRLWGNDTQPNSDWNGLYQALVHNALVSPVVEVPTDRPVLLQFQRWLQVEDGTYDHARVLVDDEVVWENYAGASPNTDHHLDGEWLLRSYDVSDQARDGSIQVRWELESDGGLEFGGWNVDDVVVIVQAEAAQGDDDTAGGDDDTTPSGDDDTSSVGDDDATAPPAGLAGLSGSGGCACDAGEAAGSWWALLGAPLLWRRRRG